MSFNELVENFQKLNRCNVDSQAIRSWVSAAMELRGVERDRAMKQVMLELYPNDARKYERVRQEGFHYIKNHFEDVDFCEFYSKMMQPSKFMECYATAIAECAREIDPDYEPPYMLGVTSAEAKTMLFDSFNSYTFLDAARYDLLRGRGLEQCQEDIEAARFNKRTSMTNHYPTTNKLIKSHIEDVYIRKEILKDELVKRGFLWRLFHPFKTADMRDFIKEAGKALKDVDFTPSDGLRVNQVLSESATTEEEIGWAFDAVDASYAAEEKRQAERNSALDEDAKNSLNASDGKVKISVAVDDLSSENELFKPVDEISAPTNTLSRG